jgi:ATP phosphoribosyltransferase
MTRRLTMALPSKGRLREPSWSLLEASGVSPQEPGERVLQAHCRNADIDLLFVRADDVPEYVQDGVVDCGITGLDLVHERESNVEVLLRLGYGTCSLQAAVSSEDKATRIEDLEGRRISTSHPRIAAKALAERGVSAEIVTVAGSVEISPRLGLADAIIDLVSTGSTLRMNGLRSIGVLFESEAVLVGSPDSEDFEARRTLTTVLGSVINARANRYLLCNVSKERLAEVTAVLPTAGSPTVMDLATPGVVAVHALVPAAEIWSLLPRLAAAGASSILTLPVERMVP